MLKNGVNIPSKEYTRWHRENIEPLKSAARKHGVFCCPVSVSVGICFKNHIRRDLDNALSSVMDILTDSGIIRDDNWNAVPRVSCESLGVGEDYALVTIAPAHRK